MRNRSLAMTALLAATAMGLGYRMEGEFADLPERKPKTPDDKEAQMRRELADCQAHKARLAAAKAKRERKNAKRVADAQKVGAGDTAFHIHEAPVGEGGGAAPTAGTTATSTVVLEDDNGGTK